MSNALASRYSDQTSERYSDQRTVRYTRSPIQEKGREQTRRDHTTPHHTTPEVLISPWYEVLSVGDTSSVKRHLRNTRARHGLTFEGRING